MAKQPEQIQPSMLQPRHGLPGAIPIPRMRRPLGTSALMDGHSHPWPIIQASSSTCAAGDG
jgi:hypothetical protein